MISGSRNEPPISISSPRDTIVSLPSASAFSASTSAPALLLTASAASAPVSRSSQPEMWSSRSPRRPVSTSYSRVEGSRIAAAAAAIAASGNGARPRLVCSTVPVRLNTRRCDGRISRASAPALSATMSTTPAPLAAARRAANAALTASSTSARPYRAIRAPPASDRRTSSTAGSAARPRRCAADIRRWRARAWLPRLGLRDARAAERRPHARPGRSARRDSRGR